MALIGISDEYGTIWHGEPGVSERIGDLVQRSDEETFEVRLYDEAPGEVEVLLAGLEVGSIAELHGLVRRARAVNSPATSRMTFYDPGRNGMIAKERTLKMTRRVATRREYSCAVCGGTIAIGEAYWQDANNATCVHDDHLEDGNLVRTGSAE